MNRRAPRLANDAGSDLRAVDQGASSQPASGTVRVSARVSARVTTASITSSSTDSRRTLSVTVAEFRVSDEGARTRLIGDISCLLREPAIPESARSAGLELIGWLARRMPGEAAHALGVDEALAQRTARRKPR